MIAKVIATASSREACIQRMSRALNEYMITGIKTTIPFQQAIMWDEDFRRGVYSTGFVEKFLASGKYPAPTAERL
jgi:acetyl-CoA carboxylase biotin carboxylase subunit